MSETANVVSNVSAVEGSPPRPSCRREANVIPAAAASALHRAVLPGLALVLTNIVMYSGIVSMDLRSTGATRLAFMTVALFSGVALSGAVFLPLFNRAHGQGTTGSKVWSRTLLVVLLGASAAAVLPGFHQYITNELLCYTGTFTYALLIAPTYYLFFSRFPAAWRGRCFGLSWGLGIMCWSLLSYVAHTWPGAGTNSAYHPLQPTIYLVHTLSIVTLAGICIWSLVVKADQFVQTGVGIRYIAPSNSDGHAQLRLLTIIPVIMFFLNGVLGARLTPSLFSAANTSLHLGFCAAMAVAVPLAGWLVDRDPRNLSQIVLPICCGLFLLAPSLVASGTGSWLHAVLQPITATAHYVVFAMCTVAAAGMAENAQMAASRANRLYLLRLVNPVVLLLWGPVLAVGTGVTVFTATVAACVMLALARKVQIAAVESGVTEKSGNATPATEKPREPEDGAANEAVAELLSSVELTPREREVATLLLRGATTLDLAFSLNITERTAKKHLTNLFRKFGVANARELYMRCFELTMDAHDSVATVGNVYGRASSLRKEEEREA